MTTTFQDDIKALLVKVSGQLDSLERRRRSMDEIEVKLKEFKDDLLAHRDKAVWKAIALCCGASVSVTLILHLIFGW